MSHNYADAEISGIIIYLQKKYGGPVRGPGWSHWLKEREGTPYSYGKIWMKIQARKHRILPDLY